MSSEISIKDAEIKIVPVSLAETSSADEQPMNEWSSLGEEYYAETESRKITLNEKGLYSPGSGDMCNDYVGMSSSTIANHPHYNYPAVTDPGIKEALLELESPIIYPDDGQELYLQICSEMNICPNQIELLMEDPEVAYGDREVFETQYYSLLALARGLLEPLPAHATTTRPADDDDDSSQKHAEVELAH